MGMQNFCVALSRDGKILASTGGGSHTIHLWETATGRELRQFPEPQYGLSTLAFSSDAKTLAAKGLNGIIHLYDTATGKTLRQIGKRDDKNGMLFFDPPYSPMGFAPGDKTIAALVTEYENRQAHSLIKFWDVATGEVRMQIQQPSPDVWHQSFAYAPDGKTLAWSGSDRVVRLVEPDTGKVLRSLKDVSGIRMLFSPDSKWLFTENLTEGKVRVWEVATGKESRPLAGTAPPLVGAPAFFGAANLSMAISHDGKVFALSRDQHRVSLLEVATGKELHPIAGHEATLQAVQFSPDGKTLTTRGDDGTLRRWEAATGKELPPIRLPAGATAFQVSEDGRVLAAGEPANLIRLWDVARGKEISKVEGKKKSFSSFTLSADGRILAVRMMTDQTIHLYDTRTGKELWQLGTPVKPDGPGQPLILSDLPPLPWMVFSPDGKTLAALLKPSTLGIWDVATGQELLSIPLAEGAWIRAVAFSADGRSVALDNADSTVSIWELATGGARRTLGTRPKENGQAGTPAVVAGGFGMAAMAIGDVPNSFYSSLSPLLAFSPDCKFLAQARTGHDIVLWDLTTGQETGHLKGHLGDVSALAFSPDGKRLSSGSSDTTALIWNLAHLERRGPSPSTDLTSQQLEAYWNDLIQPDAAQAFVAQAVLLSAPGKAVDFLREHLRAASPPDASRVKQLTAELDSNKFKLRQKATTELEKIGEAAAPALEQLLAGQPSAETRQRAEALLKKLTGRSHVSGERLRSLRAIELLEQIGTPEARQVLKKLAAGAEGTLQTQAAQGALDRLTRR
jgi:WD40 repeat protein